METTGTPAQLHGAWNLGVPVVESVAGAVVSVAGQISTRPGDCPIFRGGVAKGDSPIFVDHGFAAVPAKIGTVPLRTEHPVHLPGKLSLPSERVGVIGGRDAEPFVQQLGDHRPIGRAMGGELNTVVRGRLDGHDSPVHRPHVPKTVGDRHLLDLRAGRTEALNSRFGYFTNGRIGFVREEAGEQCEPRRLWCRHPACLLWCRRLACIFRRRRDAGTTSN